MVEKMVVVMCFGEEEEGGGGGLELMFGELLEIERGRRWPKWWPRVAGQGLAKWCECCWLWCV